MAQVSGSVDRIVFQNEESGFVVARFHLADAAGRGPASTTVVGIMPGIRPGEMLRLTGIWETHPVHGRNFRVAAFEQELPATADGIERYLASGAVRGIGPVTAGRIVDRFGDTAIQILDQTPDRLAQVPGISARRLQIIKDSWAENQRIRDLMMFLQSHEMSVALATRIYRAYGDEAVNVIVSDPYRLAHEVHGIGFRTADAMAAKLGISRRSPSRYVAGLRYALSEATDDGHVFLLRHQLLAAAAKILGAPVEELEPALLDLLRRGDGVMEEDRVYLAPFWRAETGTARLLRRLRETPSPLTLDPRFDAAASIEAAGAEQGLELAAGQREAAIRALQEKVTILTGGPGTGKTSTLRTVIAALERADISHCICAPTGRAAKRAAEATARPASTIHRLLEYQPADNSFLFDQDRPLEEDFIIVDEVSMLDTLLFYHLLKAIPPESHLLLVGDVDQLPAVGPGNVLRDLIDSGAIPTITLTQLFRQAEGSQVVVAAHAINHGQMPEIHNAAEDDLYFIPTSTDQRALDAIKLLLRERIPQRFGLDPVEDVQVITPMHRGLIGVSHLNEELQSLLNPFHGELGLTRGDRTLHLGDKVMQIRNNYDKEVYNGDMGRITRVASDRSSLTVAFPAAAGAVEVEYEAGETEELVLAYAVSVHKSQGSEFPAVIMPLATQHFLLLQRNLLYTAVTRARQLCVLVGSTRALQLAVETDRNRRRNTGLAARLHLDAAHE